MTEAMAGKAVTGLVAVCVLTAGLLGTRVQAAVDVELEAARQELRLRGQTERRMREEFESLLANGRMTAAEIADFESYLVGLGRLVDEQRRVVAELEGTGATSPAPSASLPGDFKRGQTDAEKIAMLDAELGGSLSREQKEISEKSRAASTGDGGGTKGAGSQGSGSQGSDSEGSGDAAGESADGEGRQAEGEAHGESADGSDQSAGDGSEEGGESDKRAGAGQQGSTSGGGAEGDEQIASAGRGGDAGNQASTPSDIPDGSDDDIVARQLREAAESEQDPELREKLWEEYRKYKKRKP
jgi:hypothetical protein